MKADDNDGESNAQDHLCGDRRSSRKAKPIFSPENVLGKAAGRITS